jgi:hypothetical protein
VLPLCCNGSGQPLSYRLQPANDALQTDAWQEHSVVARTGLAAGYLWICKLGGTLHLRAATVQSVEGRLLHLHAQPHFILSTDLPQTVPAGAPAAASSAMFDVSGVTAPLRHLWSHLAQRLSGGHRARAFDAQPAAHAEQMSEELASWSGHPEHTGHQQQQRGGDHERARLGSHNGGVARSSSQQESASSQQQGGAGASSRDHSVGLQHTRYAHDAANAQHAVTAGHTASDVRRAAMAAAAEARLALGLRNVAPGQGAEPEEQLV